MIGLLVIPHEGYRDFCLMDVPTEENECIKKFNTLFKDFKKINDTEITVLDNFMTGLRQRYITSSTGGSDIWDFYADTALMNFDDIVGPVMLYFSGKDMSEDEARTIIERMNSEITITRKEKYRR